MLGRDSQICKRFPFWVGNQLALASDNKRISVGSNDLIQYLLAVDRNNPHVANAYNSFHPAVLRALQQAVKGCHKAHRPISICGELAGDPLMVILLLAMGFDSLSMNASGLLRIKYVLCQIKLTEAKQLLAEVLTCIDARQVRSRLKAWLCHRGFEQLI